MMKNLSDSSLQKRLCLLALIGLVFSLILVVHHTEVKFGFQMLPSACVINSYVDCDAVARSDYSDIGGVISLAALGTFYYLIWIGLLSNWGRLSSEENRQVVFVWSLIGILVTISMMALSFFVVKRFCLYCSALWISNLLLFVLSWRGISGIGISVFSAFGTGGGVLTRVLLPFVAGPSKEGGASLFVYALLSALLVFSLSSSIVFWWFMPTQVRYKLGDFTKRQRVESPKIDRTILDEISKWQRSPAQTIPVSLSGDEPDFFFGSAEAPITIVEFGDFECPSCRKASIELTEFEKTYRGKVKVVFKNYPLDQSCNPAITHSMHKFSCQAAAMARCAGKSGGASSYWDMHHGIYQLNEIDEQVLKTLPLELGLFQSNSEKEREFWSCVSDSKTISRIQQDVSLAGRLGLMGTPTVYVNGVLVDRPFSGALAAVVQGLLR